MFTVSARPRVMSYLIFPLVLNGIFLFGFYNFCLGVVMLLIGMTVWLKYLSTPNWRSILWLILIVTCGWFSHMLTWLFLGGFILLSLAVHAYCNRSVWPIRKSILAVLICHLPSLVCWLIYTIGNTATGKVEFKAVFVRLQEFVALRFSVLFPGAELDLARLFTIMIFMLLAVGIYNAYSNRTTFKPEKK